MRARTLTGFLIFAATAMIALPSPALAGTSWQIVASPNPAGANYAELDGTLVTSSSQAWAAGFGRVGSGPFRALLERWSGLSWSLAPSAAITSTDDTRLHALTATGGSNIWAVGEDTTSAGVGHGLIERWNGSVWARVASGAGEPAASTLAAASADSSSDAWAVGWSRPGGVFTPLVERWNGVRWTLVTGANGFPSSSFNRLLAVAALSPTNVWVLGVIGRHPQPVIAHWNGTGWSIVPQPAHGFDAELFGITAISANNIWAVGGQNVTDAVIEHWNGTQWSIVPNPAVGGANGNQLLVSVKALGPSDIWAVGQTRSLGSQLSTLTEHWNGTQWTIVPSPGTQAILSSVSGLSGGPLFAVGQQNNLSLIISH
jgi:hypothetical protein